MKLLEEIKVGAYTLPNRMMMAPMTRSRADKEGVNTPLAPEYYAQRASAGLIVTEGVNISPDAVGYAFTPGIWTAPQVEAWKKVTESVHEAGGQLFLQLWHTGRVGHSANRNGVLPVSASAIQHPGEMHTYEGMKEYETPRALSTEEVKATVEDYFKAADNAMEAGFDGVELHGAFGYLPDQFLHSGSNHRTDEYGGSIENRARFVLEIMQGLSDRLGSDRVGIKLSPSNVLHAMSDENPTALYTYLLEQLSPMKLAYVQLMESFLPADQHPPHTQAEVAKYFRPVYEGTLVANAGFDKEKGEGFLQEGLADMISYGTLFLANPDLPERFRQDADLNEPDRATFYGGDAKGYTDYPSLKEIPASS